MSEKFLTVSDVAGLTGWSPLTVYKKAANGQIPGRVKLGKSSLRFRESMITAWLSKRDGTGEAAAKAIVEWPEGINGPFLIFPIGSSFEQSSQVRDFLNERLKKSEVAA